jgi:hypothetical protein
MEIMIEENTQIEIRKKNKKTNHISTFINMNEDMDEFLTEDENGNVEKSEQFVETFQHIKDNLKSMVDLKSGRPQLDALVAKILFNSATKETVSNVLMEKTSMVLLKRIAEDSSSISDKDLIMLYNSASRESTSSSKSLALLLESMTNIKNFEAERRLQDQELAIGESNLNARSQKKLETALGDAHILLSEIAQSKSKTQQILDGEIEIEADDNEK